MRRLIWSWPAVRQCQPWLFVGLLALISAILLVHGLRGGRDVAWARIQETGVWRVGMDPSFPPFENLDPVTQRAVGLDVDLAEAIAARWGVRVEVAGVGFDQLVDAVHAHKIDSAISALPVLEQRTQEVAFSTPYIDAGIVLAVPTGSAIRRPEALAGHRVAVEWGSAGDAEARALRERLDGALILVLRDSVDASLDAVLAGEAEGALVDAIALALYRRHAALITIVPPLVSDPYVVVVPANAPDLLRAVNEALAALETDGTLARIRARWLGVGE